MCVSLVVRPFTTAGFVVHSRDLPACSSFARLSTTYSEMPQTSFCLESRW